MPEQPLVEVKVVLAKQMAAGVGHGQSATGSPPVEGDASDNFRARVQRERQRIRLKREEALREGRSASGAGSGLSRLAAPIARRGGAAGGAVARTTGMAGRAAGMVGASSGTLGAIGAAGAAGAVLVGGAKIIEAIVPAVVAAVSEALGIPKGMGGDALSDQISNTISEALNAAIAAFTAVGSTLEMEKAKVRLGGSTSLERAADTYGGYYEVQRQNGELRDKFSREINKDLARQLMRLAMGGGK